MTISADLVKALREATGVGMMDCKKALTETNGDFDAAVKWLREKGLAAASKKASRDTHQGRVFTAVSNQAATILELNCETDFVAGNDQFIAVGQTLVQAILTQPSIQSVAELGNLSIEGLAFQEWLSGAILKLGENLSVKRLERWTVSTSQYVGEYVHSNGKIGVLVQFSGMVTPELAKDIAMQIAASNPSCIDRASVNPEEVNRESDILRNQLRHEGKPEAMLDKIVAGKLNRFYQDMCLLEQAFIKNTDQTVQSLLPKAVTVDRFLRYAV